MPLDATSPNLDALLLAAVLEMELSPRDHRVAKRRYGLIAEHLQRPSSPLFFHVGNAAVYAQGSRAIGATIIHGADDDRFDLDAVLEFPTPSGWTPRKVLDEVVEGLRSFPDVRKIERCTRCAQLQFAFMHLDVTPMDPMVEPRPERVGEIYHSPDYGIDERFGVNPYGFAEWFRARAVQPTKAFHDHAQELRRRMDIPDRLVPGSLMADAETEDLPEPIDPIRDAPQVIALKLMKRFLNLRYTERDEKRPVSVYLSKVAVEVPVNQFGLCAQLEDFARELDRRMKAALDGGRRPEERNPAFLPENFNDRWPKTTAEMRLFRADLAHLLGELTKARGSEFGDIRRIFDGLFGERVSEKAARSYLDGQRGTAGSSKFEHGKGFVAAPSLLSATPAQAARTSNAAPHHFHPGRRR